MTRGTMHGTITSPTSQRNQRRNFDESQIKEDLMKANPGKSWSKPNQRVPHDQKRSKEDEQVKAK